MNLGGAFYLGLRYLKRRPLKTFLLAGSIGLAFFLPAAIGVVVKSAETHLRSRADTTPLLLGAPGSPLELVFNALYYSKPGITRFTMGEASAARLDNQTRIIPIYARYHSQGARIVGTTLDYFRFRNLGVVEGQFMTRLGDCVVGAKLAREKGIKPGDHVISSPEAMFDIAGVYPLKMRVTGVLASNGGPDDSAIFTDLKTTWVIEGLAHGHEKVKDAQASEILKDEGDNVVFNASVLEYNEVTEENIGSFHFHGDPDTFPITAAIVAPGSEKTRTILLGRYQDAEKGNQLIVPSAVMDDLFATVFQVRNIVVAALALVGIAAFVIAWLVFLLSNRLREKEFHSLRQIGADPVSLRFLVAFEGGFVLCASLALAALLLILLQAMAPLAVKSLVGG